MRLKNIQAENFLSYKKMTFEFESHLYLVEGYNHDEQSNNGAGKTALLDSICYLLFGDVPRGIKLDKLPFRHGKAMKVSGTLESEGKEYILSRGRAPSLFTVTVDGNDVIGKDQKDLQLKLEQMLNIDLQLFFNCNYFHQDSLSNFLLATDTAKKDIFTSLISMGVFDRVADGLKKKIQQTFTQIADLSKDRDHLLQIITSKEQDAKTYKQKAEDFAIIQSSDLGLCDQEIVRRQQDSQLAENDKKLLQERRESLIATQVNAEALKAQKETFKSGVTRKNELIATLKNINYVLSTLTDQKNKITQVAQADCPTCFQPVSTTVLGKKVAEIDAQITLKEQEKKETQEKEATISLALQAVEKEISDKELTQTQTNTLLAQNTNDTTTIVNRLTKNKEEIEKAKTHRKTIELRENGYLTLFQNVQAELVTLKEREGKNQASLLTLKEEGEYSSFLSEMFGPKGVKAQVFARLLNEVSARTNLYLSYLFNRNVNIEFGVLSESSSGKIVQKISTTLTIDNQEDDLANLSGGERRRAIIAVNLALSDVISQRANSPFRFVIFDEAFDGISEEGKEKVLRLLQELKKDRDFILVVDHMSHFKQSFDKIIKVEKRGGVSTLT